MEDNRSRHPTDEELLGIRQELDAVERRITAAVEPGLRGVVVAGAVLVLVVAMILPHAGGATGWDVVLFDARSKAEAVILPMRLFAGGCVLFGVLTSVAAVLLRRWVLAWVAAVGCGLTSFLGLLAIWSRQTLLVGHPGGGPGVGLFLAWATMIVLAYQWIRVVWSRAGIPGR